MSKVIELGRHTPCVESVITRLYENMGRIKSISVVVEYDDESLQVCGNAKPMKDISYHAAVLQNEVQYLISTSYDAD